MDSGSSDFSSSDSSTPVQTPTSDSGYHYFSQFDGFVAPVDANFLTSFNALAIHQGWSKKERRLRKYEAILEEFNHIYGTNTSRIDKWQQLCFDVGIKETPTSITKCKQALGRRKVMVNLIDLIDYHRLGTPLKEFANFAKFCQYTRKHKFPRELAKENRFVSALLRQVV